MVLLEMKLRCERETSRKIKKETTIVFTIIPRALWDTHTCHLLYLLS